MKTEIEARLLNVNVEEFIDKLLSSNAEFVGDFLQVRKCYDLKPKKENSWIRLRTNGEETTLAYKEIQTDKIDGTKECEIKVSDFETTDEILNILGYTARSTQENRRIRFLLCGVEIDIDFWPMIPTYVEFEAKEEESIKEVCNILGITYSSLVTLDCTAIYSSYGIDISTLSDIVLLEEERKTCFKEKLNK